MQLAAKARAKQVLQKSLPKSRIPGLEQVSQEGPAVDGVLSHAKLAGLDDPGVGKNVLEGKFGATLSLTKCLSKNLFAFIYEKKVRR